MAKRATSDFVRRFMRYLAGTVAIMSLITLLLVTSQTAEEIGKTAPPDVRLALVGFAVMCGAVFWLLRKP